MHALGCQSVCDMDSNLFMCLTSVHLKYWRKTKNETLKEVKGEEADKHIRLCSFVKQLTAMCATQFYYFGTTFTCKVCPLVKNETVKNDTRRMMVFRAT